MSAARLSDRCQGGSAACKVDSIAEFPGRSRSACRRGSTRGGGAKSGRPRAPRAEPAQKDRRERAAAARGWRASYLAAGATGASRLASSLASLGTVQCPPVPPGAANRPTCGGEGGARTPTGRCPSDFKSDAGVTEVANSAPLTDPKSRCMASSMVHGVHQSGRRAEAVGWFGPLTPRCRRPWRRGRAGSSCGKRPGLAGPCSAHRLPGTIVPSVSCVACLGGHPSSVSARCRNEEQEAPGIRILNF